VRFDEIDTDQDGRVTYAELERWYKRSAETSNTDASKLKSYFQQYDKNRNGALSIAEFVPMALLLMRKPIRQSEQLFKRVDKNGDGAITPTEALDSGNVGISKEVIDGIFQVADFNHDGKITLNEFSSIIDSDPNIGQPKTQHFHLPDTAVPDLSILFCTPPVIIDSLFDVCARPLQK
ncbi:unnamed protein product, partial [Gongylonema pulchrum]|uniref:Calmodulin n=1 Tax=Gongylonema pulchrum TaxID=637853 RepID=A0A183EDN2_9BILA